MSAKDAFMQFYPQLISSLPMKDVVFIALLVKYNLLPGDTKAIISTKATREDATDYFLETVIDRALDVDDTEPFENLLKVMEAHGGSVKKLAFDIGQRQTGAAGGPNAYEGIPEGQ